MAQVIKTTFQLRRGLLETWEKNNPILAKGEPSFVIDKNALKIGDGITPWKHLEYIGLSQEDLAKAIEDYFKENPGSGTGADGRGIVSIIKTEGNGAPGTIDTYTITYTDYTTSTFTVYNGKDGKDGDDGRGIISIEKIAGNGAPGTQDTYQINYSDGSNFAFQIYNGKDGNADTGHLKRVVVEQLPDVSTAQANTIYMIKKTSGGIASWGKNIYEEYMVIEGEWELLGDSQVDLTDYAKTDYVDNKTKDKADKATTLEGYGITDAFTKDETYSRAQVSELIGQITGGDSYVVQDTAPNDTSILWIDTDDDSDDGFQEAVNIALAQAKASGEFKGEPGKNGENYVLTEADKTEIAELAAELVDVPESGGNSDYELPIGGTELGGVKNGGNVTINADGTMTAPETEITEEQISDAVSGWLDTHPEATTTVSDGAITQEKLSDELVEKLGLEPNHSYTEVKVPLIEYGYGNWTMGSGTNNGIAPILTPQKLRFTSPAGSADVRIIIRFLDSEDPATATISENQQARECIYWDIHGGETLEVDTNEWGRTRAKYIQMRWTNWPRVMLDVTAIYDSYVPPIPVLDTESEYLEDLPMRWMAQGHVTGQQYKLKFCVVPFYPDTDYYIRGAYYIGWNSTMPVVVGLPDETFFTEQSGNWCPSSGGGDHSAVHVYKDVATTENTEYIPDWIKITTKPWEDTIGCKYLAISCGDIWGGHASEGVDSEEDIKAMFDEMNENGNGLVYVTLFDKKIPRKIYSRVVLVNENWYEDEGSKAMAVASKSNSPLANAKWVLFGDSLTDEYGGHDLESNYFASKIAKEFAMEIDNRAKSGSNIYKGGSGNYVNVSGIIMLDAYLAEIEAGTTEQADYITVAFGTNTFKTEMGTNDDTSETNTSVYGATKYFIEKIREKVPNAVLGFVLSPRQDWGSFDAQGARDLNGAREAIREVCEDYGVPYIDMSKESGITVAMLPDGIHISSDQSQRLYYHAMRRFMMGL